MDREQVLFRLFGKYCREGTILYAEGSPGEELLVVQSGAVRVGSPGGGEAPVVRGPDGILGEECFFGRAARAARAEVVTDSRLLQVSDRTTGIRGFLTSKFSSETALQAQTALDIISAELRYIRDFELTLVQTPNHNSNSIE